MKDRLSILKNLLANNGAIFVHIDYNEEAYLRVLMDEIFGRNNFRNTIIVSRIKKNIREREKIKGLNFAHDVVVFYAKSEECLILPPTKSIERKERWHAFDAPGIRPTMEYILFGHRPPEGRHWLYDEIRARGMITSGDLRPNPKTGKPQYRIPAGTEDICDTLWTDMTASSFNWDFPSGEKNEKIILRIIEMTTNEGDWVLDSFLGSGTTAAVAHKMNRKWIGIELGEHCHTHCLPRLKKVVDGTDQGGISRIVHTPSPSREGNKKVPSSEGKQGWVGGGGFKYYYLAPSLLKKDKHDNWIIDERYNADMLAAAMAKHEGFRYCPDEHIYWKQGRSTEKDYIFITTQFVTVQALDKIHEEMKPDESLLICCKSFQEACENRYATITIKKIPKMLLGRCEFGKEDYSLNIVNLPEPTPDPSQEGNEEEPEQSNPPVTHLLKGRNGRTKKMRGQKSLFPEEEANEK
jgi:adenine-specific DNA-methyltransferase